jgi:biotin transport system substrate-specific component
MQTQVGLRSILWSKNQTIGWDILSVIVGAVILALASQISIPLQPVPLTFQSVTVLALGMLMGARLGVYSVITYLIAGAMGAPVFEGLSTGIHVFFGPSAGYLFGFIPAAFVSGYLAQKGLIKTAALIGTLIIFTFGFVGLAVLFNTEKAWLFGVKPFIFSEIVKVSLLVLIAPRFWKKG